MSQAMLYQIRISAGESPDDVVTSLTHAAWSALQQLKGFGNPGAHRWPVLRGDFSEVFRRRLSYYKGCGTQHECRFSVGIYGGKPGGEAPSGPTFILTLRGGLLRFVEGLSALACRRFRDRGAPAKSFLRDVNGRIQGALQRALIPYLYYNEGCSHCPVMKGTPEEWHPGGTGSET